MIKLNEALKFAEEQTKRNATAKAAQGAGLPRKKSSKRDSISPEMAKLMASSSPLLTKGMESLLDERNFDGLSEMISLGGLMGMAAQFLPPWAGDALAVGKALASGDLAGAADALLSKYLPPELKAVYDAIKNLPGGWQAFLKWLFENPKEPQGPDGAWAARITDIVACGGGAGPIQTGLATLIIGGQFAARVTDIALCIPNPVPDVLDHGEPSVIFGGQWATRKGDFTAHKGKITTGFKTVHIGKAMANCDGCLTSGASGGGTSATAGAGAGAGGAATISGAGITDPFVSGAGFDSIFPNGSSGLGGIASGLGDMAKNKLAEFASRKAFEALGDLIGADKDKISDGGNYQNYASHKFSEKPPPSSKPNQKDAPKAIPKPQPFIFDDEDFE